MNHAGGPAPRRADEPAVTLLAHDGSRHGTVPRMVAHQAPGILHLAVSVQVVDLASGRWLLQRRAPTKAIFAHRWANTCCTHPAPGEDPAGAARRRLREETALVVDDLVAAGSFTYRAIDDRSGYVEYEHDYVYLAFVDASDANPDPDEISELALVTFEAAIDLVEGEAGAPWAAEVLRQAQGALIRCGPPPTRQWTLRPPTAQARKGNQGRKVRMANSAQVHLTDYQRDVAAYWNTHTNDPVNLELGKIDDIYHHHYGLGDPDPSVLEAPSDVRDDRILAELHRLETAQAELLLEHLGRIDRCERVLDAGSGRGGTSIMANARFGCHVDGISISEYQVNFANEQARGHRCSDRVHFHCRNMLDTEFPDDHFRAVWTNETTMYVDLIDLYHEFHRLLPRGGRYVCITGCYNDVIGAKSPSVTRIDTHYICNVHARSTYFKALAANDLVPIRVVDLTADTIPYWELRQQSSVRTGIEEAFLTAYREGSFHYLLIVADRL